MNWFKKKKNKINKLIFSSSLVLGATSCSIATNLIDNSNNVISKTNTALNADTSTTAVDSSIYDHTNYFQMPTTMPTGFAGYDLFATTNNSQLVQTSLGILGISTDKSTFYFTSYSGKIIWAQQFNENSLVKKFYAENNWDLTSLTSLKIKEWTMMDSTNNILAVLLGDGTNSFVTCLSLNTGLFYPSSDATAYTVDPSTIFVNLGSDVYTTISKFLTYIFVTQDYDTTKEGKMLSLTSTSLSLYKTPTLNLSALTTFLTGNKIVSIFGTDKYLFAFSIAKTPLTTTASDGLYRYEQFITTLGFGTSFTGNTTIRIPGYFISNSSTLDTSNFKNTFFVTASGATSTIVFIDGNQGYNHLNVYTFTSPTGATHKNLSLEGNTISSVAISSDNSTLFFSNSHSTTNTSLWYVNLANSSLSSSVIRQSTDTSIKNYYLIPVLSYTNQEYLLLQDNSKSTITYLLNSGGNYNTTNLNATYNYWNLKSSSTNTNLWNAFGKNYLPSGINNTVVSPFFDWTNIGALTTFSFKADLVDDENGTIRFSYTVGYRASYLNTATETFVLYFYINNLFGFNGNFVFNWIDSTSTATADTSAKIEAIKTLKSTKYANQITADDIINNFITYDIKNSAGASVTLDASTVSLSYSADLSTLDVIITIPSTGMPNGFSNNVKHIQSATYTGFMSIGNYTIGKKTANEITTFTNTIFPSELTKEDVFSKFISIGSGFANSLTINDFSITISNVDDIKGSLSISVSVLQDSISAKIPNYEQLPDDVKALFNTIFNNVQYSSFKALDASVAFKAIPSMITLNSDTNEYLPSEIWGQYQAYLSGSVAQNDVILLKNLGFSLTDKNNLIITCLNQDTCDDDKFLKLEFTVKDGSETSVDYSGSQYASSNGKLVFNTSFIPTGVTYPYVVNWNIDTSSKYFTIIDQKTNTEISSDNNTYSFNMKQNSPFSESSSLSSAFATAITESDISSLINTAGFDYTISLESNENKGYVLATIDLTLTTPPLYAGDNTANNSNYVKTIYLYNFNIPMGQYAKEAIAISVSVGCVLLVAVLAWYLIWKYKLIGYKKNSYNWKEKQKGDLALKHLTKKQSFFKLENSKKR